MNTNLSNSEADLALVTKIRNAENDREVQRAFEKLFNKYHDSMLYRFSGLVRGDKEAAKEIILVAFEKASANIGKFNEDSAVFSTWLFKLTQNVFIDNLRKKKEKMSYVSDLATYDDENNAMEFEIPSEEGTPESKMITDERNLKIDEIINRIENKNLSDVVKMRFFEGMSYEKIAVITGKPVGTIKAYLFRAKDILKKEFAANNITL